ncbi:6244_t:CDS:10 [Paraglomus brasilianum]|uniref:6244_t:CDS:1 n=1 Tax=Paraglomus brasilianum TaxID=144538 RepID=A0A9N9BRI1_9GLOM|nr:6244_t:CDS:10 [Paraglomus brasilianum]
MSQQRSPPPIMTDISSIIGNTPIVRLNFNELDDKPIELLAKLEFLNPVSGSIKDRVARRILNDLEKSNKLHADATLIIPTTGNLGIAIALLSKKKGYKTLAVIPERTSSDRIHLLKTLGVEIIRTPNEAHRSASESNYALALKLASQMVNSIVIDETTSLDNVQVHYDETAKEILTQVRGKLDLLVVGVESGGTVTGLAKNLKSIIPGLKVVAVEPQHSSIEEGKPATPLSLQHWRVEDIGNNFTPSILDTTLIDTWIKVTDKDSFATARKLMNEGLMAGPSSGSVVSAALQYVNTYLKSSNMVRILTILNDSARNYNSTLLSDDWLLDNDLLDEEAIHKLEYQRIKRYRAAGVEDLQLPAAVTVTPTASITHALELMLEREYSQLPVIDDHRKLLGYVSQASLQTHLEAGDAHPQDQVAKWMFSFVGSGRQGKRAKYQIITPDTPLSELAKFLDEHSFAVVTDSERKWCLGVATKYDLISFLNRRNAEF